MKQNIFAITNAGDFIQLNANGTHTKLIQNLDAPFDFAFDKTKNGVWITEQGKKDGRVSFWKKNTRQTFQRVKDSRFNWKNPEGILYSKGFIWVLDTEPGLLVQVSQNGLSKTIARNLGVPILIKEWNSNFIILSNNFQGSPAVIMIQ